MDKVFVVVYHSMLVQVIHQKITHCFQKKKKKN